MQLVDSVYDLGFASQIKDEIMDEYFDIVKGCIKDLDADEDIDILPTPKGKNHNNGF